MLVKIIKLINNTKSSLDVENNDTWAPLLMYLHVKDDDGYTFHSSIARIELVNGSK